MTDEAPMTAADASRRRDLTLALTIRQLLVVVLVALAVRGAVRLLRERWMAERLPRRR